MITFVDSAAGERERGDGPRCLDPQLWHACAGGMVQMPPPGSRVYYFPQGHAEHAQGQAAVDFPPGARLQALVLCRVAAVRFMADPDTDEVFAKIRLVPARPQDADANDAIAAAAAQEDKPASFAKTLTQSDANNGGGFSVPRYCAETIFPRLDYSADPPVQTVLAKDVHGVVWKFRHIYRGTPRRHLLTTGWSSFVNQKKLVAGDSIVFMRTENGDLCVGIRRAKKGGIGGPELLPPPSPAAGGNYGGFSMFLRGEEDGGNNKMMGARGKARVRVRPEEVAEAANLAASGQPFDVLYYPRASTPEFCVRAAAVRAAMRTQWCPGMRFKMAFETEDSSRISWFMGTVSAVQVADPIRWPNSPWRLLQVTWDEPDLLQNVKRVSPWLVELVSNMPAIHLAPFSPPRKKLCVPFYPDLPVDGQFPAPMFHGNPLGRGGVGPMCYFPDGTPAGIQGARHAQFGISLSDLHLNKLQSSLSPHGLHQVDHGGQPRIAAGLIIGHPAARDDISCMLTIGNHQSNNNKSDVKKASPQLMLFGKPILTEQQITLGNSGGFCPSAARKSPSDMSAEKSANNSDLPSPQSNQNGTTKNLSCGGVPLCQDNKVLDLGLDIGHCKIFMQSEDVGRTLDLSAVGSYEELYRRLSDMFGMEKAELMSHVFYRDAAGALKHTGDEPFSDFTKTARRLTILTDTSGDSSVVS
ncbi:auxin response factor 18 [Aegilops tauschii subsp. strangulata]|uniref:Auxin response factor n=1 Tax=Aegilops tauschii subsp. strangulata TaxID=200361 RepID=A0A453STZ0_AEGTS|nr:auxin response factor 18 [Aegilops tauschii subsp. strangulata]